MSEMESPDDDKDDGVFEEKPSAAKLSRKIGEKLRRDRLNSLITQLAEEIPLVKYAHRRLDKSAILRLTVSFMKLNQGLRRKKLGGKAGVQEAKLLNWFNKVTDEALLIVTQSGIVLYVSPKITDMVGFYQTDIVGHHINRFIHPDDLDMFMSQFTLDTNVMSSAYATFQPKSEIPKPERLQILQTENNSFYIRVLKAVRGKHFGEMPREYETMFVRAHCEKSDLGDADQGASDESWMVASMKPFSREPIHEIELKVSEFMKNNEWASMHDLDSKIVAVDQRASLFNGYLVSEIKGKTPYTLINSDDLESVALSHQIILKDQEIPSTVFRMNTKMDAVLYVQARSIIINDQWTKRPKCIVSVNTVLGKEEGKYLLALQKQKVEEWKKTSGKSMIENSVPEPAKAGTQSESEDTCDVKQCKQEEGTSETDSMEDRTEELSVLSLNEIYDKQAQRFPELYISVKSCSGTHEPSPVTKRSYESMDSESNSWESVNSSVGTVSNTSSTNISDGEELTPRNQYPSLRDLLSSDKSFKKASITIQTTYPSSDPKSLPILKGILEGRVIGAYNPSEKFISQEMIFKHSKKQREKEVGVSMDTEEGAASLAALASWKVKTEAEDRMCCHAPAEGVQSPTVGSSDGLLSASSPDMEILSGRFTSQLETKHALLKQTITSQKSTLECLRDQLQCSHNNIILDHQQRHVHDTLIAKLTEAESQVEIQGKLLVELQDEIRAQKQSLKHT